MSFDKGRSISRLVACGLSTTQSNQIVNIVQKWAISSGEEWTVSRLKGLKVDFLRHLAGLGPVTPWVRKHRNGRPKGPFGVLWKLPKTNLFRAWNALMIYTAFEFVPSRPELKMTSKQFEKFIKAVRRPPLTDEGAAAGEVMVNNAFTFLKLPQCHISETGTPLMSMRPSPTKRAPLSWGMGPEVEGTVDSIAVLAVRPSFYSRHKKILDGTLVGLEDMFSMYRQMVTFDALRSEDPLVGSLSWIQEPGYKLRFVANPHRVFQMALKPLGDYLYECLRHIPLDGTFDQDRAVARCQQFMNEGYTPHCFDLSNATDNFPLSVQMHVLRRLGVPTDWITFFSDCCQGDWSVYSEHFPRAAEIDPSLRGQVPEMGSGFIRWSVGQPLGLYPSFASFALAHHAIICGIFVMLEETPRYMVLGDDVVIFNDKAASIYKLVMSLLGVTIASEKGIESPGICEFAGRVIFPTSVLRGYKWRGHNDNSFIDVARNLGPGSITLFRPRQRKVLRILGGIPDPWGFGWNTKGIGWWERLEPWLDALESNSDAVRQYETRAMTINRLLYNSRFRFLTQVGYDPTGASDQDASELVQVTLGFRMIDFIRSPVFLLPNVESVLRCYGSSIPHPISSEHSALLVNKANRVFGLFSSLEKATELTELIRYERKLRKP